MAESKAWSPLSFRPPPHLIRNPDWCLRLCKLCGGYGGRRHEEAPFCLETGTPSQEFQPMRGGRQRK